MSQIDCNQATAKNKKTYHSPQLKKFGNVSEITLTSSGVPGDPSDGGSSFNQYAS